MSGEREREGEERWRGNAICLLESSDGKSETAVGGEEVVDNVKYKD